MKTVFITAFEGVECKNILRTAVLDTLLKEPEIRLVLLMKNRDRVKRYKKEFNNPKIIYEVAPYSRHAQPGLDKFFSWLKFALLRTDTTNLHRKMILEIKKNYVHYYLGLIFNFLFARSIFVNLSRFLDFLFVHNRIYTSLFDKYRPDLVLCAHLFEEPEIHLLREAKRRNVRTVGLMNSWDKVTTRCIIRLLPDKIIVFNGVVKDELIKYSRVHPDIIFVSGVPHYDHYFSKEHSSREDFFAKIKVNPSKKLILYSPIGKVFSNSEWDMIDLLYNLNKRGLFGNNVAILVRFPPNDVITREELKKRPYLIYTSPGIRFAPNDPFASTRGVDWDMDFFDLEHLKNTLYHSSLIIAYATSLCVDAAVFGKPIININFEVGKRGPMLKSPTQYFKKTHYKSVIQTGGVRLVNDEEELADWVNRYLHNPSLHREERKKIVKTQCQFIDGKSGERIGKFILSYLNSQKLE